MTVPSQAIALIQKFEGLRLKTYMDGGGRPTIGFGHCGPDVAPDTEITVAQADALLAIDAESTMSGVQKLVSVPLNNNQLSALISFAYNVGLGHFENSGLLTVLNQGHYDQVPHHLVQWNKVDSEVEAGLTRRRSAEVALWQSTSNLD